MLTPDQFTKNALREALRHVSAAETEVEVLHATQRIDLFAIPSALCPYERAKMGLLGDLAAEPALFEAFWNTPGLDRVRRCVAKQLAWYHELERRARVSGNAAEHEKVTFPWLNILTTGRPNSVLDAFGCREVRPGVYEAAAGLCLRVVVISELARDRATLLLRLFGRGEVFGAAMVDFDKLPEDAWERRVMTPLLNEGKVDDTNTKTNQEELVTHAEQMRLLAEVCRRGIERGGQRKMLLRQLQSRFGDLPASVESRVREAEQADLDCWAERILRARTLDGVFAVPRRDLSRKTATSRA